MRLLKKSECLILAQFEVLSAYPNHFNSFFFFLYAAMAVRLLVNFYFLLFLVYLKFKRYLDYLLLAYFKVEVAH